MEYIYSEFSAACFPETYARFVDSFAQRWLHLVFAQKKIGLCERSYQFHRAPRRVLVQKVAKNLAKFEIHLLSIF